MSVSLRQGRRSTSSTWQASASPTPADCRTATTAAVPSDGAERRQSARAAADRSKITPSSANRWPLAA